MATQSVLPIHIHQQMTNCCFQSVISKNLFYKLTTSEFDCSVPTILQGRLVFPICSYLRGFSVYYKKACKMENAKAEKNRFSIKELAVTIQIYYQ